MENKRVLPPTYLFISILAMVILHWFIPILVIVSYPWNLIGLIPLIAGIVLNIAADAVLKKEQTTVKPFQKSSVLVTTGVYRISRHPMYLGMVIILIGIAILMGTLAPVLVIAIFTILMELVFVRAEEEMLENQFGLTWIIYKNKIRKWV